MILLLESHDDNERVAKRGKTRGWIRRREEKGYFENITTELSIEDTSGFKEMMRMSKEDFIYVLEQIFFLPETISSSSNSLSLPASKLLFGGQGGLESDASPLTFDALIFANCLLMR